MATSYPSSFDAEVMDNTLLSIPEVYTAYVHPTLIIVLRLVGAVLAYCFLTIAHVLLMALKTILYPVYVIGHVFIIKPIGFLFHVCHLLYPVAVYLSFAVICGLMMGGCAGFTAEALSSFFINATWGSSASPSENNNTNNNGTLHGSDDEYSGDGMTDDDIGMEEDGDYYSDYDDYVEEELNGTSASSPLKKQQQQQQQQQQHRLSAFSSSLASIWKGTTELDVDSDTEGDGARSSRHHHQKDLQGDTGRRSPTVSIYSAKDNKQMKAKGKHAMRQFPGMTTTSNNNDLDDNTPRYRIGKKTMAHDTE